MVCFLGNLAPILFRAMGRAWCLDIPQVRRYTVAAGEDMLNVYVHHHHNHHSLLNLSILPHKTWYEAHNHQDYQE